MAIQIVQPNTAGPLSPERVRDGAMGGGAVLPADLRIESTRGARIIPLNKIAGMNPDLKTWLELQQRNLPRQNDLPLGAVHTLLFNGAPGTEKTPTALGFAHGIKDAQVIDVAKEMTEIKRAMHVSSSEDLTLKDILKYAKQRSRKYGGITAVVIDQIENYVDNSGSANEDFDDIRNNNKSKVVIVATTDNMKRMPANVISRFESNIEMHLPERGEILDLLGLAITSTIADAKGMQIFSPELTDAAAKYEEAISTYDDAKKEVIDGFGDLASIDDLKAAVQKAANQFSNVLVTKHTDVLQEARGLVHREIYVAVQNLTRDAGIKLHEHASDQPDAEPDNTLYVTTEALGDTLGATYRSYPKWHTEQSDRRLVA